MWQRRAVVQQRKVIAKSLIWRRQFCCVYFVVAVSADSSHVTTLHHVIFPCVSLLVVTVSVSVVVCVCRHRRRRRATDGKSSYTRGTPLNGVTAAAAAPGEFPLEFSVSSVQLVRDICDDHRFRGGGRVYLGQLAVQRPCRPVVVRTLAADADECARAEFWRDVDALYALRHPHVASVVGVTGRSVVGAAASVLLECGPDLVNLHQYVVYAGNDPTSLDHAARLRIAAQIAAAMDYLSSRGIVHGDLASRNVLMMSTPGPTGLPPAVAKLSVGLSIGPVLFPGDYQKLRPDCPPLPVRWMSPEAITTVGRSLTTPTDVWSYGITLWELYSAGCRPYEGFNDHELVELILSRQLLPCPPPPAETGLETSRVYGLMVDCWALEPDDRPTFADVLARLEHWQAADAATVTTAGRCPDLSSRSNSTRSNSDAVPAARRSSPSAAPVNHCSTVIVPTPPPDASQWPANVLTQGPLPSADFNMTSRGVTCPAQSSSRHGRRLVNDHCTSAASSSPERRLNDRQPLPQPTDAIALRTVDVL